MFKSKLMLASAGVFLLAGCQSHNTLEAKNKALVKRYVDEILNGDDLSTAHEIIAPDYTFYRNGKEVPEKGVDVFKAEEDEIEQYSSMVMTDEKMIAEGNTVAVRWHQTATLKPEDSEHHSSTKRITWYGMSFYTIENGLMVEGRIIDVAELYKDSESR